MSSRDDADYWGLDLRERIHFHGRISAYYGRLSAMHYARADRYGRIATRLRITSIALAAVGLAIVAGKALGWWA